MSTLTKDDVDVQWEKINEFERVIPGIRYGEDYPEFALAIVGSKAFQTLVSGATMLGLMSAIIIPAKMKKQEGIPSEEEAKAFMEEIERNSPMREALLRALYLGYKLGKGQS
jgi:hypothetical protein